MEISDRLATFENDLPVSALKAGGSHPVNATEYENRDLAQEIPIWLENNCTQCNKCAIVCPHSVIRPFLFTKDEVKKAPESMLYKKAKGGGELSNYNYSILVAPYDCTGCSVCVEACPDDALYMKNIRQVNKENLVDQFD